MIDALEAYLRVTAQSGSGVSPLESFVSAIEADVPSAVDDAPDEEPSTALPTGMDEPPLPPGNPERSGPVV
jgi:hypothetical protein